MLQLNFLSAVTSVVRNQLHRALGGALRGGHRTSTWTEQQRRNHAANISSVLFPHLGSLIGRTGLEVGPGDNLDVCKLCLSAGAKKMYAVERYSKPTSDDARLSVINSHIESIQLPEPVDFAYSSDVFEHVGNVAAAYRSVYKSLKPSGLFVSTIDLRGHNVFNKTERALDFLTCPDWLWGLMFSHIATTNRIRAHEFVNLAQAAGFVCVRFESLASADPKYLSEVRPHLIERYQNLSDDALQILQLLVVLQRPGN